MLGKNNHALGNFAFYKDDKSILKKQNIERNDKNLVNKNLDAQSYIRDSLLEHIF